MISHWSMDDMTRTEAKDFLTHYICSCPYGTSPINCGDEKCSFGIAVRTLCVEERPQGDLISRSNLKKAVENLVAGGEKRLKDYYENGSKSEENEWIGGVYDAWELINKAQTVEQSYQEPKDYIKNKLDYLRPQSEQKCVTCKYRGCGFTEKPCRECSRSYANLYKETEND